jgi:hypothetical protein
MSTVQPPRLPAPSPLPPSSRYVDTEVTSIEIDGEAVRYFCRRFIPSADEHAITHDREVLPSDRLDIIAAAEHGDAELWWRVADANGATRPRELTDTPGRRLRISMPFGMQGESP